MRQLAAPTRRSGVITVVCILALIPISRLLASYWPGDGLNLVSGPELDSGYSTLWQVQAGIAAVALPLLIFVIERSRDTPEAASTSAEVLILNSYALPIIAFALAVTFNIGVNLANGETATTFTIDLALFGATCLLTLVAYYRVVRLLFTPHELKARSRQLQRERAIESSLDSLRSRASLRLLGVAMREVGLRFDPGGPPFPKVKKSGWPCQKRASTNTATRRRVKAMSGRPGTQLECTRHPRTPAAHSARRSANSGLVFFDRILLMTRLRVSFDRKSAMSPR
jgi:hypothetical protein